ncbi:MAG: YitT family protein [Clostridiales bacterium]|nr:YitT family protein [Clostridiales bacterium]
MLVKYLFSLYNWYIKGEVNMQEEIKQSGEPQKKKELVKLPEQSTVVKYIKEYMVVVVAAVLQAIALHVFIQPNNFSPGGFFGLATFAEYVWGWNAGIVFMLINVPLIIWAAFKFKKDFLFKTTVTIVLNSLLLLLLPAIGCPTFKVDPNTMGYAYILCAAIGGILCGIPLALLLKVDGCNGGTEIISAIIQKKYPATNISWFIFAMDSSAVVLSAFFFDASDYGGYVIIPMILSLIKMFCSSKTAETITRGMASAIKFEVVTLHGKELGLELTTELKRGVTIISAIGAYSGAQKDLLICVVRKRQMARFKRILSRYPDTFAYIVPATEVYGQGFTHNAKEGEKETVM